MTYLTADLWPVLQCHIAHIVVQRGLLAQLPNLDPHHMAEEQER